MRVTKNPIYDALYYLHKNSGASDERVRGVVLGLACGLQAHGELFETIMETIYTYVQTHPERNEFRDIYTMLPTWWVETYNQFKEGN